MSNHSPDTMSSNEPKPEKIKLKERLHEWQGHLMYLHKLVKEDPGSAWSYWRESYLEQDKLKEVLDNLQRRQHAENFDWEEVPKALSFFHLRPEDQGQAEWYLEARRQYQLALETLENTSEFRPSQVERLMKELHFIAQADQFHQKFQLTPLQEKVRAMYNALQFRIDECLKLQKQQLEVHLKEKELEKIRAQEEVVKAESEKLAHQHCLVQEQRLKVIEEKKRLEAKRDADEAERLRMSQQQEFDAVQEEKRRREELSGTYRAMQEAEMLQKAMAEISLQNHSQAIINYVIEHQKLSGEDLAMTARLYDVLRKKLNPE